MARPGSARHSRSACRPSILRLLVPGLTPDSSKCRIRNGPGQARDKRAHGRGLNRRGLLIWSVPTPKKAAPTGARFMATRLRHIAIIVPDPETAAQFFEQAFGMTRAGSGRRGIYMSDGVMNVALLKRETDDERIGLYH